MLLIMLSVFFNPTLEKSQTVKCHHDFEAHRHFKFVGCEFEKIEEVAAATVDTYETAKNAADNWCNLPRKGTREGSRWWHSLCPTYKAKVKA